MPRKGRSNEEIIRALHKVEGLVVASLMMLVAIVLKFAYPPYVTRRGAISLLASAAFGFCVARLAGRPRSQGQA